MVLRSMTGYGSARVSNEKCGIQVEIKALNHRYREIKVRTQRELSFVEAAAVSRISGRVERGSIDAGIRFSGQTPSSRDVQVDIEFSDRIISAMEMLADRHKVREGISLEALMAIDGVLNITEQPIENEGIEEMVMEALDRALDALIEMRENEGRALEDDLVERMNSVSGLIAEITGEARIMPSVYRDRIKTRITALLEGVNPDPERLETEIAVLVDRSDISEELTRLSSHVRQFMDLCRSGHDEGVGRRLGFLLQEMNREINTVGSKSQSIDISRQVVEIKSELERVREQVQNIE